MNQSMRDKCLVIGFLVTSAGLALMLISFFITLKVSKLSLLLLMLLGTALFYRGLHPEIQARIQQNLKCYWRQWWQQGHQFCQERIKT